jgi:hypothetical protein
LHSKARNKKTAPVNDDGRFFLFVLRRQGLDKKGDIPIIELAFGTEALRDYHRFFVPQYGLVNAFRFPLANAIIAGRM